MNETLQWDAFAARLRTVGFQNPHVIINGHRAELEALNDTLRYLLPELEEDAAAAATLEPSASDFEPTQPEDVLPLLHEPPRRCDGPWRYPAGLWRQSE